MINPLAPRVIVVGAGISGLTTAKEISNFHPTTVIDRLPVVGGTILGYEHPFIVAAQSNCDSSGVQFLLGTTALRWSPERTLFTVGPTNGILSLPTLHLIYAGGIRPSTLAELRIDGSRVKGIYAAPVAYHLMENGVYLGDHVVVIGSGDYSKKVAKLLKLKGSAITVVTSDNSNLYFEENTGSWWQGWKPVRISGNGFVRELYIKNGDLEEKIDCDAVILATNMRPNRNIEGAIFDEASSNRVSFVQLIEEVSTVQQRQIYARNSAQRILRLIEKES